MVQRVKTAVLALGLLIAVLLLADTPVFAGAIALVCLYSFYEVCRAMGLLKHKTLCLPGFIFCALAPVCFYYQPSWLVVLGMICFFAQCLIQLRFDQKITVAQTATAVFFWLMLPLCLGCAVLIRALGYGEKLIALMFLIPWMSDSLAYIVGSSFGKHKLCPTISPHKSVEGAIAGMFGGIVSVSLLGLILWHFYGLVFENFGLLLLGATLCSALGQAGDLFFSVIKRQTGIKDYSNLFPGHGGMADRFDSVIFVTPALWLMLSVLTVL